MWGTLKGPGYRGPSVRRKGSLVEGKTLDSEPGEPGSSLFIHECFVGHFLYPGLFSLGRTD